MDVEHELDRGINFAINEGANPRIFDENYRNIVRRAIASELTDEETLAALIDHVNEFHQRQG